MKQTKTLHSPPETRYCTLICNPSKAVRLQQEILSAIYGWKVLLISRPLVKTIASKEMLLPQSSWNEAGLEANRSLSHLGWKTTLVCDSLRPSSARGLSRSFRRNLVCFAKSGQVDRLPLPRLIPTIIFNRCHCSESPGSEPGFRCERQAGCQVLFALSTQLEAPALTLTSLEAAHSSDVTQHEEQLVVMSSIYDLADSWGRLYGICRCSFFLLLFLIFNGMRSDRR